MYKPPENCNRVKSIKSKFENNSDAAQVFIKPPLIKSKTLHDFHLDRQLSDPAKRNIKRSPAFRLDKNSPDRVDTSQKNVRLLHNRTKLLESKVKSESETVTETVNTFTSIRNKFDVKCTDLKNLYAEPIPKSLRVKNNEAVSNNTESNDVIKPGNLENNKGKEEKITLNNNQQPVLNNSTLKLNNTLKSRNSQSFDDDLLNGNKSATNTFVRNKLYGSLRAKNDFNGNDSLTDTLKKALNKPLPAGPAPKKPPRTFAHTPTKIPPAKIKGDPKYCLEKLENLLKTKGPVVKRPSLDEKLKGRDNKESPPSQKFNLNCLGSFNCSTTASSYEKVKEPSSSFFVRNGDSYVEPVYAEPFEYQVQEDTKESGYDSPEGVEKSARTVRRSVHYASSPIAEVKVDVQEVDRKGLDQRPCNHLEMDQSKSSLTSNVKDIIRNIERGVASTEDTDSRVRKLKTDLESTLNELDSLSADSDSVCSNSENSENDTKSVDKLINKFETYVKRVRSVVYKKIDQGEHLFYCCLLVGLDHHSPYIKKKFPRYVQVPYKIEELCFPDSEEDAPDQSSTSQCYSLVVTNETGERTFGYCRRVLPEGSATCLPLVYCILSKNRAPGFYRRVLEELESRHGFPERFLNGFLQKLYACKFPKPGDALVIDCSKIDYDNDRRKTGKYSTLSYNKRTCDKPDELNLNSFVIVSNNGEYGTLHKTSRSRKSTYLEQNPPCNLRKSNSSPNLLENYEDFQNELIFMRPSDVRHEENDLKVLCDVLSVPTLQQVFGSLLLERKLILVSSNLSKLSSCIEALQVILYPFTWPHTFIPVLPLSFYEILEAPTPLICGVLSPDIVKDYSIENGMVVDLEKGTVLLKVGDEDRILPNSLLTIWKQGLSLAQTFSNKRGVHNVFLSDAFLRVFVQCCGHYKDSITEDAFNVPDFIQNCKQKGKSVRKFLKWFTETTMFNYFVDTALNDRDNLALFDQRIQIYGTQSAADILRKMKNWSSGKGFFRFDY